MPIVNTTPLKLHYSHPHSLNEPAASICLSVHDLLGEIWISESLCLGGYIYEVYPFKKIWVKCLLGKWHRWVLVLHCAKRMTSNKKVSVSLSSDYHRWKVWLRESRALKCVPNSLVALTVTNLFNCSCLDCHVTSDCRLFMCDCLLEVKLACLNMFQLYICQWSSTWKRTIFISELLLLNNS